MVVKVVSQGQAVPKNRSGFGIVPDTAAGMVLEEDLGRDFLSAGGMECCSACAGQRKEGTQ